MDDLLAKISSYNVFTNLLPGVVFCFVATNVFGYPLMPDDVVAGVFFYYFVGMIISRVGSLVVEPLLIWMKLVEYADYKDYVAAAKVDEKIPELLETNNMYRSGVALAAALLSLAILERIKGWFGWSTSTVSLFALSALALIMVASFSKQTTYIRKRVAMHKGSGEAKSDGTKG